jgi:hypothetical protein
MLAVVVIQGVAILLLGVLVAGLLRSHAEILRRLHDLGAGLDGTDTRAPAPLAVSPTPVGAHDIAGITPDEDAVAVGVVGSPEDTLLAFLTSGCSTCEGFFRERPELPARTRLVIVTRSPENESVSAVRGLAPAGVTLVMSDSAWEDYGVPGSPYFVLVDGARGRVRGEGAAQSWHQVTNLMAQALADARDGGGREARADAELLAAGIHPGHTSLYDAGADS